MNGERILNYRCPDCGTIEPETLKGHLGSLPLPVVSTVVTRCGRCFSAALDKIFPGARERTEKRLGREEKARLAREARRKEA
jgi:hypothetical protein